MSRIADVIFGGEAYRITSPYGPRGTGYHYGCDYGTYLKNLPQYAVADGTVTAKGYEANGAGYYIWISYPALNKRMLHCHLQRAAVVEKGQSVVKGTMIGYTGTTGNSTGIHLHLGVRDLATNKYEDPEVFSVEYEKYLNTVTVEPLSPEPVRMIMGYASAGDVRQITSMLADKEIPFTEVDGFVITDISVSKGDQIVLVKLCSDLGIPCLIYHEEESTDDSALISELRERIAELEADKAVLSNRVELRESEIRIRDGRIAVLEEEKARSSEIVDSLKATVEDIIRVAENGIMEAQELFDKE